MIGVSTKTLRRWDKKGSFSSTFRTMGNHRRYCRNKVLEFIRRRKGYNLQNRNRIRSVIYGRVSASKQKKSGELQRQLAFLRQYLREKGYKLIKSYCDVGSGLNDKRKGLVRMLRDASNGKFDLLIVNYNDRLARFGLGIIKEYLYSWGVEVEVLHPTIVIDSPHAELITDLTAILYSFMGKLYRLRRK
jgi:predicted site-specific integrase-resolvase